MKRLIVVGSGIAGLIAALEASRSYAVTLVTKARLADSNTRFAQGGIAAAMFDDDSVQEHMQDTLRAGAGLCDRDAVEVLCAEGPARIRDLIALGVAFDQRNGQLARGLEAAHSRPRVLHAGGDATGLAIETALVAALRQHPAITILEHTFACDLVLEGDRVHGLEILDADGKQSTLYADAVILASGGAGNLYRYTTNPSVATGDGVAIALRAGTELSDVEFYQFHPTALAATGNFLISEAVRGEGAVLRNANGERFMKAIHADAELAPRDVVARGIAAQMAKQGGVPVLLDATALGPDFLKERFPTIDAASHRLGLDWATAPIPVTPAAHYWMGGVRTDVWGRTSVRGLFAVGEVACTGVHGANRLASNSLLESLVFAWRAAQMLLDGTEDAGWPEWTNSAQALQVDLESGPSIFSRIELQQLMWDSAGISREETSLRSAAAQLASWGIRHATVHDRENANLLLLSRTIVAAALERRESRGAHFRSDHPVTSEAFAHASLTFGNVGVAC